MSRRVIPGLEAPDAELESAIRARLDRVEEALEKAVRADSDLLADTASLPAVGRRQALPPDARAAVRLLRRPDRPAAGPGLGRDRARAPGHAVSRRRDRRGGLPPRNALGERPLGQHRRDPHGRLPVRAGLGDLDRPRHRRLPAARPHDRGAVRRADPRGRLLGQRRAGGGELPRDHPAQDRGAHRHLVPARRDALGRRRPRSRTRWRRSASRSGWPSSCPTTSWTSPPARWSSARSPGWT